jgi:uncharacterized membrane protein
MKPLIVLLSVFLLSLGVSLLAPSLDLSFCGRLAMAGMLVFTSLGHFRYTQGMMLMLPAGAPAKSFIVQATGLVEMLMAVALFIGPLVRPAAIALILFFVLLLPVNVHAARRRVNLVKADFTGPGIRYLWFRIPLQALFIGWAYFFILKPIGH